MTGRHDGDNAISGGTFHDRVHVGDRIHAAANERFDAALAELRALVAAQARDADPASAAELTDRLAVVDEQAARGADADRGRVQRALDGIGVKLAAAAGIGGSLDRIVTAVTTHWPH